MKIKGILFDFNGTMLFDSELQEKAWKVFIKNKLNKEISNEEIAEHIHGGNNKDVLTYFFNRNFSNEEVEKLEEEKESLYRNMCLVDKENLRLVKGLPELLDKLKENKIPITIATGAPLKNVEFYFEHLNLDKWFDMSKVVYTDGSFKGKPEPDVFLKAAEKINMNIEECAIFEDAVLGLKAAEKASAGKIFVISSILDNEKLSEFKKISRIIQDYTDITIDDLLK